MKRVLILTLTLTLTLTLSWAVETSADVVVFTNGRSITGKVIDESPAAIKIAVAGGVVQFPRNSIARIERTLTPDQQITLALEKADRNDPDALDRIAALAAGLELERRAADLRELASGIRLERRLDAIRGKRDPLAYLELESWASLAGYSFEVRRFILQKARALAPNSPTIQRRLDAVEAAENRAELADDLERARAEIAEREAAAENKRAEKLLAEARARAERERAKSKPRDPKAEEIARLKRELEAERERLEDQQRDEDSRVDRLRRARRRAAAIRNRRGITPRRPSVQRRPAPRPPARRPGVVRFRIGRRG